LIRWKVINRRIEQLPDCEEYSARLHGLRAEELTLPGSWISEHDNILELLERAKRCPFNTFQLRLYLLDLTIQNTAFELST